MPANRPPDSSLELTVSWAALVKILVAVLSAFMAVQLWPLVQLLFLGLLIAITFSPVLR